MGQNREDLGASAAADRAATPSEPSPAVSGIAGIPSAVEIADRAWRNAGFDIATNWEAENMIFAGEVVVGEIRRLHGVPKSPRAKAGPIVQRAIREMRKNSKWWDGLGRTEKRDLRFGLERTAASAIEAATAGETTKIGSTEGESATRQGDAQNPPSGHRGEM